MVKNTMEIIQNGLVLKEPSLITKSMLDSDSNLEEYNKKLLIKNTHLTHMISKPKKNGLILFLRYSNIVLTLTIIVYLKKIMNFGLLHSTVKMMKLYLERTPTLTRLMGSSEILMDIVKYGENSTQHKNQSIGLYGLTRNLKVGVKD
jgi:hypothetical protein